MLICDGGERYQHTCYDDAWLARQGYVLEPHLERLRRFYHEGAWPPG
jgi:cysteine synthase A